MKYWFFILFSSLFLSFTSSNSIVSFDGDYIEISDARLAPDIVKYGDTLHLNGFALMERFFIDLYVVSLYVPEKTSDSDLLINSNRNSTIRINLVSSLITADRFEEQFMDELEKDAHKELLNYPEELRLFFSSFKAGMAYGDVIDFSYSPQYGFQVIYNGVLKTSIPGNDFKKLISGIWLGEDPFNEDLRLGLLGLSDDDD